MAHTITNHCTQCGSCVPQCPKDAIQSHNGELWIDPMICDDCQEEATGPHCVTVCEIDLPPMPLQAKKGRCRSSVTTLPSPPLFTHGKPHSFASALVVWEGCNVLAQHQTLSWQADAAGYGCYERVVNGGRGTIALRLTPTPTEPTACDLATAQAEMANWDVRAACLHLIYAAHASALERPWEQEFIISDRQIENYLGWKKRKDLSKLAKLTLIKELVQRPCNLLLDVQWFAQGRVPGFTLTGDRMWQLLEIQHHFQEDELGCKHLTGFTFRIQAGEWSKYFLNRQGARSNTAFYQYSSLPQSALLTVSSIWQQHEGAARILLWLLFKTNMGNEQRLTIPTLMRIAYGEARLTQASLQRDDRKRLLRSFEGDLEVLNLYGLQPIFDPVTYPEDIQPLWFKLAAIPDDADDALEFWTQDGSQDHSLTDAAPRDKWRRLMQARLWFELPQDWEIQSAQSAKKKLRKAQRKKVVAARSPLSGQQIRTARERLRLSQRDLAMHVGKSQSWVRDIESGRLKISLKDQQTLLTLFYHSEERLSETAILRSTNSKK